MTKRILINAIRAIVILISLASSPFKGLCQVFAITGPTCMVPGFSYPYMVVGTGSSTDKWCISGGTINGSTSSCLVTGSQTASISWNAGISTGTLTYYHPATTTTPLVLTVTIIGGGTLSTPNYLVGNGVPTSITITGTDVTGCGGSPSYQWQIYNPATSTYSNISGATGRDYSATVTLTQNTTYRRGTSISGIPAAAYATIGISAVSPLIAGTASPSSVFIYGGASPGLLTGTASTGGICGGSASYQWQISTDSITWSDIVSANNLTYTPSALFATTYYRLKSSCSLLTAYTNVISVKIYPPLLGGRLSPLGIGTGYNTSPGQISGTAASGGAGAPYDYQWESSTNGTTWTAIPGAIYQNYTPPGLLTSTFFRRQVNSHGQAAYSDTANVHVRPQLITGSLSPDSVTINYNKSPGTLTCGASGGDCAGFYSYQWQQSSNDTDWSDIDTATAASFTPSHLIETVYLRRKISCSGDIVYSNPIKIKVNPQVFPGAITPSSINIETNTSPGILFTDAASGGACGGNYSYQWQQSNDNSLFSDISSAVGQHYTPGSLSTNIYFRRRTICGTDTVYTGSCFVSIGGTTENLNYIRVRDITRPGIVDSAGAMALTNPAEVRQTTQYFDGLGRLMQTVNRQASPLERDLVAINLYDSLGREAMKYLPYAPNANDGKYKPNTYGELANFNSTQFPGENLFYGQTIFEPSPLNRVLGTYAPGSSWVGAGRGIQKEYLVNTTADSVQIWEIDTLYGSRPVSSGAYPAGQLYKHVTIDEQGHQTVEYTDKQNKTILKKVQLSDTPAPAYAGWLCTYYVYDDWDNLRFVLSPRAVQLISDSGWVINPAIADELCFRYEYDHLKRMVIKKVPGAGEVWMVYDSRDRLVMSQDAVQRSVGTGRWLATKYDNMNRPDSTVLWTDANNRVYHQNLAAGSTNYPAVTGTFTLLTCDFYDDYSWRPGVTSLTGSLITRYTSNSHYFITNYNAAPAYAVPLVQSLSARGMLTGHYSGITTSVGKFVSVYFYDDHGRMIQKISDNWANTVDTLTTQYEFSGKPLRTLFNHGNAHNGGHNHKILTKMSYDAGARLTSIWKNIDSTGTDQQIDSMQYNELGQLKVKYLGNNLDSLAYDYTIRGWLAAINKNYLQQSAGAAPLHYFGLELGYDKTAAAVGTTSYKGLQYNGNIAGTIWKSAGDGVNRQYDFSYDNANRLTKADFNQQFPGGWGKTDPLNSSSVLMDFSTNNLTYDVNGNIGSMTQKGFKLGGSVTIDSLNYGYLSNSNKLNQVMDVTNDTASVLGDFHYKSTTKAPGISIDYQYDGNGNLTQDVNKGITAIAYTYQNLPSAVTFGTKGQITYDYDADGTRLRKRIFDNLSRHLTVHLYINGLDYRYIDTITGSGLAIDTLDYIPTEEGRLRWAFHKYTNGTTGNGWEYDFFEKDHLGNTRVVLSQEKDTAQYMATMETANRATENALFYNIDSTAFSTGAVPGGYPGDTTINKYVSKVNGLVHKMGPAILLKVMSGDSVVFGVQSFYRSGGTVGGSNSSLQDILNSLAGGLMSVSGGGHGVLSSVNTTGNPVAVALNSFLPTNDPQTTTKPKAYLNWMLVDNQFNYVSGQSGAKPVGAADVINTLANTFKLKQSGYLYIWVSNETPTWDAFFDNLSVVTYNGPMLEENHYYPFGLTMAGISDKALKTQYAENKYRFNKGSELQNKEFSDGSGLELYETQLRSLDPQLGRWWQIDSKPNEAESPYASMGNNPILNNDPLGDTTVPLPAWAAIPKNKDGDQTGQIRNATHEEYQENPLRAVGKDIWHMAMEAIGFNTVDDQSANIRQKADNGTLTTVDVGVAALNIGLAATREEGAPVELHIDLETHPDAAFHAEKALNEGVVGEGVIDRAGRDARRADNLAGVPTKKGKDRDEFPPAVINNGGRGQSVMHINPHDNRGAGASLGNQIKNLPDNTRVIIVIRKPKE